MTPCPTTEDLLRYLQGECAPDADAALTDHLEACTTCQRRADELELRFDLGDVARAVLAVIFEEGEQDTPASPAAAGETTPLAEDRQRGPRGRGVLRPGDRVGRYEVCDFVGGGGMGEVYEAFDATLERLVALKVMRPAIRENAQARERFLREARAAAALHDDHVVPVYDSGEDGGHFFLVMPLLCGETLEARLKREATLPPAEVARVGREVASGLAAAHARGLVHRDVKPANVWLEDGDGRAKVLDFGLARAAGGGDGLTFPGVVAGTPEYMSPEQVDGKPTDARSDLFSLGVTLYRCATGRLAFAGPTATTVLVAVTSHDPPPPHEVNPAVPGPLSELIVRLLAKEPAARPQSAREVADALARGGDPARVHEMSTVPPARRGRKPVRVAPAVAALVLAATLMVGVVAAPVGWNNFRSAPATTPAAQSPLRGSVDVRVWKKPVGLVGQFRPEGPGLPLSAAGVLPLREGDHLRIEVELNRPAYAYVVWLDAAGKAVPYYPWQGYDWSRRPAREEQTPSVLLPPGEEFSAAPLTGGPSGLEAILLLVREEPLPPGAETQLQAAFARRWRGSRMSDLRAAAWLENGELVRNEAHRGPINLEAAVGVDDPVQRAQGLMRTELSGLFGYTRGVCYGFQGQKDNAEGKP